uniref:Uncharacterized protein n=1 Tax=Meloidogyne enterolobii TaxID=390850 RepID=A0A6V7VDL4_MELEN|nr:unnamed protein product [Meloidogyne enterolobii]
MSVQINKKLNQPHFPCNNFHILPSFPLLLSLTTKKYSKIPLLLLTSILTI